MWDESQYVELYNNSSQTVNLAGWSLYNENGLLVTFPQAAIPGLGYWLIAEDAATTVPADYLTLLNLRRIGGDALTLKDQSGNTVDTANAAGSDWFAGADTATGISMERLNPALSGTEAKSWGNSQGNGGGRQGTPKSVNSIYNSSLPIFLISRVNFKNEPDWVEIRCLNDGNGGAGINLTGYNLTDLATPDKVLGNALLKTGETLRITYNTKNNDENSAAGGNGNGILDVYTSVKGLISTNEQVVFAAAADKFLDAVAWSAGTLPAAQASDLLALYNVGQWSADTASSCIDSNLVTPGHLIYRKGEQDTNSAADWQIAVLTQPPKKDTAATEAAPTAPKIRELKISPNPLWLDSKETEKRKTLIDFYLEDTASLTAVIYDTVGRVIRNLTNKTLTKGPNQLYWQGQNEANNLVPVGIYVLYLKSSNSSGADQKIKTIVVGRKH